MKRRLPLRVAMALALLSATWLLASCAPEERKRAETPADCLVVGFSQMEMTNPWRIAETISIQQAAEKAGASIVIRDAQSSVEQQVTDCLELLSMPVDYLVLAPRLDDGYQRVFEAARDAGIPVILVDRETAGTPGQDYACCITADFAWEGKTCARILAEAFEGKKCQIIELTGTPGSFVAKVRSEAFAQEAARYPNMDIVFSASGDFVRTTAQAAMENILQTREVEFQAIFAHDDDTGIGAIQALKGAGLIPGKDVLVVSIAGQKDALKAIIAGELLASVECNPRLGGYLFDTILAMENGEEFDSRIVYSGMVYDASNAEECFDRAF